MAISSCKNLDSFVGSDEFTLGICLRMPFIVRTRWLSIWIIGIWSKGYFEVGDNDDILCEYENIDMSKEVLYRAVTISDDEAMLK